MKKMEKALVVMTLLIAVMITGATLATMQENRNQNQNQNGNGNRGNGNMSSNRTGNGNMNSNRMNNSNTGDNMNGNMNANMGGNMNSNMHGNMNMSGNTGGAMMVSDTDFAMMAAQGGLAEVQMAQLAQQKATSKDVQKYAKQMIKDHTKANSNLMKIAAKKQMTLPTAPNEEQMQMMSQLQNASGAEFDRMYMEMAGGAAHQKMLGLFQSEANNGTDAELKSFAAKTLPVVQKHLRMAQETMNKGMTGGNTNTGGGTNTNSNRNSNSNSNR